MRNAGGHQCKVKMSGSEKKVNEKTYISSIKRVTKKFLEVSRCKVAFLLIRPIVVFHRSPSLLSPFSST